MPLIRKYSLSLFIVDEYNKRKKMYFINDSRTLYIMFNEIENSYILRFKVESKQMLVSTRHFQIAGCTYAKS